MAQRAKTNAAKKTAPSRPSAKLYWCATPDNDEDWFIVATTQRSACRQHEIGEGYGPRTASAELVCELPAAYATTEKGWPSDDLLFACGAEFIKNGAARMVRIGDRIYGEGDMAANVAARMGHATWQ
jgi:hypothetical protein